MKEMKKRMKFDSDGDKNINFDEVNSLFCYSMVLKTSFKWKAVVTTLNDALAVTMVEVFDGITGTKVSSSFSYSNSSTDLRTEN